MARPPTAAEIASQELAIQRKLLFDGMTNADTRILKFVHAFSSWCGSSSSDKKTNKVSFLDLRTNLDRLQYDAKRSYLSIKTAEEIKKEYLSLKDKIQEEIFLTRQQIAKHKRLNEEMQTAKNERIQYDHLLSLVHSKPDRKAVEFKVEKLKGEVNTLQVKLSAVDNAMSIRKKQLTAMMQMAQDLSFLLKEDCDDSAVQPEEDNGILAEINPFFQGILGPISSPMEFEGQTSLDSVSGSNSVIQNGVEIHSDEEMQDAAAAAQYVLQIQEPVAEEANAPETLFLIESDSFEELLLLNDDDPMEYDNIESPEKPCTNILEFDSISTDESFRCRYFTMD